jgi:heterodisulfide reductase subunit B
MSRVKYFCLLEQFFENEISLSTVYMSQLLGICQEMHAVLGFLSNLQSLTMSVSVIFAPYV